ncbi:hypothetical protein H6P81_015961 [Aristolochia fimbriata]|uniref:Senescence-associated protein n=1 Tax=Aristolochia fimbriata TaxID=158543 RepID=A0AAV7E882_ARIFI|nr:hypothetical protein H6P81_015961 [Aristolochia fimbriata]
MPSCHRRGLYSSVACTGGSPHEPKFLTSRFGKIARFQPPRRLLDLPPSATSPSVWLRPGRRFLSSSLPACKTFFFLAPDRAGFSLFIAPSAVEGLILKEVPLTPAPRRCCAWWAGWPRRPQDARWGWLPSALAWIGLAGTGYKAWGLACPWWACGPGGAGLPRSLLATGGAGLFRRPGGLGWGWKPAGPPGGAGSPGKAKAGGGWPAPSTPRGRVGLACPLSWLGVGLACPLGVPGGAGLPLRATLRGWSALALRPGGAGLSLRLTAQEWLACFLMAGPVGLVAPCALLPQKKCCPIGHRPWLSCRPQTVTMRWGPASGQPHLQQAGHRPRQPYACYPCRGWLISLLGLRGLASAGSKAEACLGQGSAILAARSLVAGWAALYGKGGTAMASEPDASVRPSRAMGAEMPRFMRKAKTASGAIRRSPQRRRGVIFLRRRFTGAEVGRYVRGAQRCGGDSPLSTGPARPSRRVRRPSRPCVAGALIQPTSRSGVAACRPDSDTLLPCAQSQPSRCAWVGVADQAAGLVSQLGLQGALSLALAPRCRQPAMGLGVGRGTIRARGLPCLGDERSARREGVLSSTRREDLFAFAASRVPPLSLACRDCPLASGFGALWPRRQLPPSLGPRATRCQHDSLAGSRVPLVALGMATLPLTIPVSVFKSSQRIQIAAGLELCFRAPPSTSSAQRASPRSACPWGRKAPNVGRKAGDEGGAGSSLDSDLEAFSHNPTHGSFTSASGFSTKRDDQLCESTEEPTSKEGKSNVAMNAWLPQASYPLWSKGSIGHAFTVRIRTGNQNQTSFYPFVPHEISVLVELILGHLRYLLTDVPPQPNSPPDNVFRPDRLAEASLGTKRRGNAPPPTNGINDEAFGYLKRVIVTPAVYPRLVEFLHFDIQSTGDTRRLSAMQHACDGPKEVGAQGIAIEARAYEELRACAHMELA